MEFDPRKSTNLHMSLDEASELKATNERFHHDRLRFSFVNDHCGFRPGAMHLLIGRTGAGKSSVTRSIVFDLLRSGHHVLTLSTEETEVELKTQMAYAQISGEHLKRLHFIHESNIQGSDVRSFLKNLELALVEIKPALFVFDNLTTSRFTSDFKLADQFAGGLREVMKRTGLPFFVIAHTESSIKEAEWFGSQHIRGSKLVSNRAEYVYLFFNVMREISPGQYRQTSLIRTEKSRAHPCTNRVYRLRFDGESREYIADEEIAYETFKAVFKSTKDRRP